MPLVSRMLIAARGTRGAPLPPVAPHRRRIGPATDLPGIVRTSLSHLTVARAELDLPLLCSRFVDILLDPEAARRTDLPAIAPQAALEVLLELARLERRGGYLPEAQATFARAASTVHLAMNRWLCARRETEPGLQHAQPNLDPARWIPHALRTTAVVDALLDALRTTVVVDFDRCLRDPVQVQRIETRDITGLVAIGCVGYRFARHAHLTQVWTLQANDRFRPRHDAEVRPFAPLASWDWLDAFVNRSAAAIAQVALVAPDDIETLAARVTQLHQWLRTTLRTHVRRSRCLPALRRTIRAAMPYPRAALTLACRIRPDPHRPLTAADVDAAERRLHQLDPAIHPNRGLLHLAMLVAGTAAFAPDPQELKLDLRALGLSKNAWRLLCRHGVRAYASLIGTPWFRKRQVRGIVETANLIVACQRDGLPPRELLRHLAEVGNQNPTRSVHVAPALLRAAWDAARALRGPRARAAFAEGAFARAVVWWWAAGVDAVVPRGAPWRWFDAAAIAWETRARIAHDDPTSWSCPIATHVAGAIRVKPLGTVLELWDEAQAMRHCVAKEGYLVDCLHGVAQVVSLSDARTGKRLATAAYRRDPGPAWQLTELRGFANRSVERRDLIDLADRLAAQSNARRTPDRAVPMLEVQEPACRENW